MKKTTTYARKRGLHRLPGSAVPQAVESMKGSGLSLLTEIRPFDVQEQERLTLPPRMAYEAIRSGRAQEGDFDTLAAVVNVALVRCESIGQEGVELCKEAQESLMHMRERHRRTGRWGVDAQAMANIPAALDLHEQLLELSNPHEMKKAMLEVLRRCKSGQVHRVAAANTGDLS